MALKRIDEIDVIDTIDAIDELKANYLELDLDLLAIRNDYVIRVVYIRKSAFTVN